MPLPVTIEEFIIKTNEKINKSNYKVYCKPCVKVLGEIEGKKTGFPNKKDHLITHFKKCIHFFNETPEKREEIFNLLQKNNINSINSTNLQIGKRKGSILKVCLYFIKIFVFKIFIYFQRIIFLRNDINCITRF